MGSNSGDRDERPVHEVCLDDFWMGKYEVTQEQWDKLMAENRSANQSKPSSPIDNVTWHEVQRFIVQLNEQTGKTFALPTEAQWEFAARNGGKDETMLGKNDIDRIAWYRRNTSGGPQRVGSKAPNELGIHDMIGNVSEWCEDVYVDNAYAMHDRTNPLISRGGSIRVKRGGSCGTTDLSNLRPANRDGLSSAFRRNDLGFRLSFTEKKN